MITADYVRAQWAYSELLSLGHGQRYTGQGVPELREKARSGVPFDELGTAEHYLLVDQFDRVRGRYLNRYLLGITAFRRVEWTRQDLGAVYVIPYFLRDVVIQFFGQPPDCSGRLEAPNDWSRPPGLNMHSCRGSPVGQTEPTDPRKYMQRSSPRWTLIMKLGSRLAAPVLCYRGARRRRPRHAAKSASASPELGPG